MKIDYISITDLQRKTKKSLEAKPFQIIMHNNQPKGMILSQEVSQFLLESGMLEQIREELYELHDHETVKMIKDHRKGKTKPVSFDSFVKKHGI